VAYRVTSADGHPISGRITFDAKAASADVAAGGPTPEPAPTAAASPAAVSGSSALPWVGLLAALAAVAVVLVLLRRSTERRTP
jgi:hypothetical protein